MQDLAGGRAGAEPEPLEIGVPGQSEPWPATFRDEFVKQGLHCLQYVDLSGEIGADWGACASELSQYDGQLVFEHWTGRERTDENLSSENE